MSENVYENQTFKNLAVKISELLNGECRYMNMHYLHYYWLLNYYAEELIKFCFGDNYSFPIDVDQMAHKLGLCIMDKQLNSYPSDCHISSKISQLCIRKDSYTGEIERIIYVDPSVNLKGRRSAIARQISYYLQYAGKRDTDEIYHNYSVIPMCPINSVNLTIDIFVVFLLIPMSQFFKMFNAYVNVRCQAKDGPIATEEWIGFLSEEAGLPVYETSYAYQYLRSTAYWTFAAHYLVEPLMRETDRDFIVANTSYFDVEKYNLLFGS